MVTYNLNTIAPIIIQWWPSGGKHASLGLRIKKYGRQSLFWQEGRRTWRRRATSRCYGRIGTAAARMLIGSRAHIDRGRHRANQSDRDARQSVYDWQWHWCRPTR